MGARRRSRCGAPVPRGRGPGPGGPVSVLVVVRAMRGVAVRAVHEVVMIVMDHALVPTADHVDVHVRLMRQVVLDPAATMVHAFPALRGSLPFGHSGDGTR